MATRRLYPDGQFCDKFGQYGDPGQTLEQRYGELGRVFNAAYPLDAALADTAYGSFAFTTPAATAGTCYLVATDIAISTGLLALSLFEGTELTDGAANVPICTNRILATAVPFASIVTDATFSTGTELSLGHVIPGGTKKLWWIKLKAATVYALKMLAVGNSTNVHGVVSLACIPEA